MNPAYRHVCFRGSKPEKGWADAFGVVTAYNPDGVTVSGAENERALAGLRAELVARGFPFFEVTGGPADFSHAEPGFGIQATLEECLALGRRWRQEAVFWVEEGTVTLISCTDDIQHMIGEWADLLSKAPPLIGPSPRAW